MFALILGGGLKNGKGVGLVFLIGKWFCSLLWIIGVEYGVLLLKCCIVAFVFVIVIVWSFLLNRSF